MDTPRRREPLFPQIHRAEPPGTPPWQGDALVHNQPRGVSSQEQGGRGPESCSEKLRNVDATVEQARAEGREGAGWEAIPGR